MSSNIGQNYPYSSESEEERAAQVARAFGAYHGLAVRVAGETVPLPREDRWWVWKCPEPACPGLLHATGYAKEARAVYTVCDTCGRTYRR